MSVTSEQDDSSEPVPWQQRLLDNLWLLAGTALVFFFVSYVGWALYDVFLAGI
jgi:hypothetical protein